VGVYFVYKCQLLILLLVFLELVFVKASVCPVVRLGFVFVEYRGLGLVDFGLQLFDEQIDLVKSFLFILEA